MERIQFARTTAVILALAVATCGAATAQINVIGSVSEFDSMTWTISSSMIDGVLDPGEVQTTTTYGENTLANDGLTSYAKFSSLNTGNMISGQYNMNTLRMFSFNGINYGSGTGRMVSDENVGIETVGMPDNTTGEPAFYESVSAGSSLDLSLGSVMSQSQAETVAEDEGIPLALNYQISLTGLNYYPAFTSPAIGSASSYFSGHIIEGRDNSTYPSSDLAFSQYSSATGLISHFDRSVSYHSGPGNWFY